MELSREETAKIIWPQLQNAKFKEFYINLLLEKYQKQDRDVNIFLVLVTSTSISAWAIWKTDYLQWVWAVLVAASQVIQLIKPYLNYSKYIKELTEKYYHLQNLNLEYEKLWHDFKFEKMGLDKTCIKAFELKDAVTKTLKFGDGIILDDNKRFTELSRARVLLYLKSNFNYQETT